MIGRVEWSRQWSVRLEWSELEKNFSFFNLLVFRIFRFLGFNEDRAHNYDVDFQKNMKNIQYILLCDTSLIVL